MVSPPDDPLAPITSLIAKSEKALRKVPAGSWQHAMLSDHLEALRIASLLLVEDTGAICGHTQDDLRRTVQTLTAMERKARAAQTGSTLGTSQRTLLQNRIAALNMARAVVAKALDRIDD